MTKALAKLDEVIGMIEAHEKTLGDVMPMLWRKFTYENHEFSSCTMCGHSDKALVYELKKVRRLLTPNKPKANHKEED